MRAHADAPVVTLTPAALQTQRTPHGRIQAVGADDETAAAQVSAHAQPDGAAALDGGALDGRLFEHAHARRGARRSQQRLIQRPPPLAEDDRRAAVRPHRELGLGRQAEAVIAHRRQRPTTDGGAQAMPLQHRDARGHDAFAARLLARKLLRLVQLDGQPGPPEQQRQRRARRPAARDYDVGHGRSSREEPGFGAGA